MKNMILNREVILATKLRIERLFVPEWGGSVFVKELTAKELEENGIFTIDPRTNKPDISRAAKIPTYMCLKKVVDDQGKRVFNDSDLAQLEQLHGAAVSRIADKVRTMSGLKTGDEKANDLADWLTEHYPDIYEEYQAAKNPVEAAKENF